ncbi:MAG: hypothetical protein FVQ83_12865 [Chloroflexi bacterium]|nr:hypothetical protein [Chloroflexota bacterium]
MIDANKPEVVLPPVEKSIQVSLPVDAAFKLFTQGLSTWWPLASHSVGLDKVESCIVEEHEGGRVYEIQKDGSEAPWGTVLAWEPPHRFMMSWHPGRDENTAQELEVLFDAEGEGTRIELIHRGWETLGDKAKETREGYITGWDTVLGNYVTQMKAIANP